MRRIHQAPTPQLQNSKNPNSFAIWGQTFFFGKTNGLGDDLGDLDFEKHPCWKIYPSEKMGRVADT